MKSVYGPVPSWRLGRSLGIDPICSENKVCSFDCVYCPLPGNLKNCERKKFIGLEKLKQDFKDAENAEADVITFSGTGEPSLAENLEEMIAYIRAISKMPLAILTNSTLLNDIEVCKSMNKLDIVVAKLDASNESIFKKVNRPHKKIVFENYLKGLKEFREQYSGKFALQIMFVEENKDYAEEISKIAKSLHPDEIQINTPLRPCKVKPLSQKEIEKIKANFEGSAKVLTAYDSVKPIVNPLDLSEVLKRRPEK